MRQYEISIYYNYKSDIDFDYETFDIKRDATFEDLRKLMENYNAHDFIIWRKTEEES